MIWLLFAAAGVGFRHVGQAIRLARLRPAAVGVFGGNRWFLWATLIRRVDRHRAGARDFRPGCCLPVADSRCGWCRSVDILWVDFCAETC